MKRRKVTLFIMFNAFILFLFYIPTNAEAAAKMPKGSMIANTSIAEKTGVQARQLIETEIETWQAGDDLILKSEFEQIPIPRTVFEFNLDETTNLFNERTKRTFTSLFMKQKNVHIPLVVQINESHEAIENLKELNYINTNEVLSDLTQIAGELEQSDITITYKEDEEVPLHTIAEIELEISNLSTAVLSYGTDELNEYIIGPNDHFSLLEVIEFPENLTKSSEEISFLGSAMYAIFLQTNFEVAERHPQLTETSYAQPGLDVSINRKKNKDLIAVNPNEVSYKVEAEISDGNLRILLKAAETTLSYKYELEKAEGIEQRTLYRYSKKLNPGEEQVIQKGRKGLKVEVRRATYEENNLLDSKLISQDVYLPKPTIILASTLNEEAAGNQEEFDSEEEMDESAEELDEEMEDIKQSITQVDETVDWIDKIIASDLSSMSPDGTTLSEQLLEIKQTQAKLAENIATIEKEVLLSEEELEECQKEIDEKFDEINEQLEELLESFLSDGQEEEETDK